MVKKFRIAIKVFASFFCKVSSIEIKIVQFFRFSGIKDNAIFTVMFINEVIGTLAYDKKKYIEFKTLRENFFMKLSYANFTEPNSSKHSIDSTSQ